MHELKIFITPDDVISKLSDEDRTKFNRCLFKDVEKSRDGSVTISCILYNFDDHTEQLYRQKIVSEHPLKIEVRFD